VSTERASAFAPGRVNLIGEHTDYNGGLALPFAISQGVVIDAVASEGREVRAFADDLGAEDRFELGELDELGELTATEGWRAFVRGAFALLARRGAAPRAAELRIGGDLPRGAGLSSSAALEVALCLALLALSGVEVGSGVDAMSHSGVDDAPPRANQSTPCVGRLELAELCSRIENDWVGAQTGLLDQLASLYGVAEHALLIDFARLGEAGAIEPVPLRLGGWRLVVLDSGERHAHARGDYNKRREECARAAEELGVRRLSEADSRAIWRLPEPLRRRARHVLSENERVLAAVAALRAGALGQLGALLDASHASLREDFEISTPAVEATVQRARDANAAGARIVGGGFGGCVLALFAPDTRLPPDALDVHPGAGAHLKG
jgi:galactokinase